jgi:hypothetical protein
LTLPRWAKGDPKRFIRIHRQVSYLYCASTRILYLAFPCSYARTIGRLWRVTMSAEICTNGWT